MIERDHFTRRLTAVMLRTADIVNRVSLDEWTKADHLEPQLHALEFLLADLDDRVSQLDRTTAKGSLSECNS